MGTTKATKRIGEIFIEKRQVSSSIGMDCVLAHLEGGIVLLASYVQPSETGLMGEPGMKCFVFKAIEEGEAVVQFASYHAATPGNFLFEERIPFEILPEEGMDGGWTFHHEPDESAMEVFSEALRGFTGVKYTPVTVATQVVAGTNYCFLCDAVTVTKEPEKFRAYVYIFRPLPSQGEPYITDIVRLED